MSKFDFYKEMYFREKENNLHLKAQILQLHEEILSLQKIVDEIVSGEKRTDLNE